MNDGTPVTDAGKMTRVIKTVGILLFALPAGCAGLMDASPGAKAQTGPLKVDPSLLGPNADTTVVTAPLRFDAMDATVMSAPPSAGPGQPVMTGDGAIGIGPAASEPTPPSPRPGAAKTDPPHPVAPVKAAASPVAIEQPRKTVNPPLVARPLEPSLDVAALKVRLRDTNAIGVFTKLALKNQMDDLLKQFRAHYQGGEKTSVESLRQPYNMLVLKVLSVVQDGDPALARTISGSREAIWSILADREKFNSVT